MHLKVIQTMQKIPRSIGIPPLSDSGFDQALALQANALAAAQAASGSAGPSTGAGGGFSLSLGDDDGKINPLAGMGLTDEQYTLILQNLFNNESFVGVGEQDPTGGAGPSVVKRALDDAVDGRDPKRSRFEIVE